MVLSRRKFLSLTYSLPLVALTNKPAWADNIASEAFVRKIGQEVLALAQGRHRGDKGLQASFADLLKTYINIPGIANFALGTSRSALPEQDKPVFYNLVANYAAALFAWYVSDFQGAQLAITGSNQQGKFVTVDSRIDQTGEQLRWRVSTSAAGLRISDVNVKGIWLSLAMKKMFEDTLHASGGDFQALYARLREAETW